MIVNQATLDSLRVTFSAAFSSAYEQTKTFYEQLCVSIPSNGKSNTYGFKAFQTRMQAWVGPRSAQNLSEHAYTLINNPYEATVELDRDDIEDDNIGVFSAMTIPDLANAAKKHPDQLLATLIAANPTAFDGKALFANDHPTYAKAGFTSTYDNLLASDLDGDGVQAVFAAMSSIIGENGDPLGIIPDTIIVPPQLNRHALVVANSMTYAVPGTTGASATVDNPLRGLFKVIMIPELAGNPNDWFMADLSKPIKPFVHQTRRAVELVTRDSPTDPKVFDQKKFTYGVDCRDNMGVTLPFLIAKSIHTP